MKTAAQKANYIVRLYKSIGENLETAVAMAVWYSNTDREQKEIEGLIPNLWAEIIDWRK